jgi:hypothetical protein
MLTLAILNLSRPARALQDVPFKGRAEAKVDTFEFQGDNLHLTGTATGVATHLGAFTREEDAIVDPFGHLTATIIFIAANGDLLCVEAEGDFISDTTAIGTYRIKGGTGRFVKAGGEAAFVAVSLDGIHFDITFDGSINFKTKNSRSSSRDSRRNR